MEEIKKVGELDENDLENVTGGNDLIRIGGPVHPHKSNYCNGKFDGPAENRNGTNRRKCTADCKYETNNGWYECKCWGTGACVGRWHSTSGCG